MSYFSKQSISLFVNNFGLTKYRVIKTFKEFKETVRDVRANSYQAIESDCTRFGQTTIIDSSRQAYR